MTSSHLTANAFGIRWWPRLPVILVSSLLAPSAVLLAGSSQQEAVRDQAVKRPVTVADAIRMTKYGDPYYFNSLGATPDVASFSPDGNFFVIVVQSGNLERNTTDSSLLLFQTGQVFSSPTPDILVSFSSSSNRAPIQDVKWLDNQRITFLGEHSGELQQLYVVDRDTKEVKQLTTHPTNVLGYTINCAHGRLFFAAEKPTERPFKGSSQHGIVVSGQLYTELISGESEFVSRLYRDVFAMRMEDNKEAPIAVRGIVPWSSLWLSPDGEYLIVETIVSDIPPVWRDYDNQYLRMARGATYLRDRPQLVYQYLLIDTKTGESRPLLDAPVGSGHSEVAWFPDSRSVVVSGTYLPLNVADPAEKKRRRSARFIAEITLPSLAVTPITDQDLTLLKWRPRSNTVLFENAAKRTEAGRPGLIGYEKARGGWKQVKAAESDLNENNQVRVIVEEDMNTPPRIFVTEENSQRKALLLDLNPQLRDLAFGSVQSISFRASDGHSVKAGLYRPVGCEPGRRYPLVIQTHAWNPQRFWIDGPYTSAFAAQPLAGRGFVVVQLEEDFTKISTPEEAPQEMASYQGAIDYLDSLGLIDRIHVGIIGFSRTGMTVEYALTHSRYRFAAATLADPNDVGYFRYLTTLNALPWETLDSEHVNGGVPFGPDATAWLTNSPAFRLDRVTTPVRLEAYSPNSLSGAWEWFAGLLRLSKPVELLYLPDGKHVLVRPWNRMTSQQGNVDWFRFWLKGEEDADAVKTDQYARWRELRKLQEANQSLSHQ